MTVRPGTVLLLYAREDEEAAAGLSEHLSASGFSVEPNPHGVPRETRGLVTLVLVSSDSSSSLPHLANRAWLRDGTRVLWHLDDTRLPAEDLAPFTFDVGPSEGQDALEACATFLESLGAYPTHSDASEGSRGAVRQDLPRVLRPGSPARTASEISRGRARRAARLVALFLFPCAVFAAGVILPELIPRTPTSLAMHAGAITLIAYVLGRFLRPRVDLRDGRSASRLLLFDPRPYACVLPSLDARAVVRTQRRDGWIPRWLRRLSPLVRRREHKQAEAIQLLRRWGPVITICGPGDVPVQVGAGHLQLLPATAEADLAALLGSARTVYCRPPSAALAATAAGRAEDLGASGRLILDLRSVRQEARSAILSDPGLEPHPAGDSRHDVAIFARTGLVASAPQLEDALAGGGAPTPEPHAPGGAGAGSTRALHRRPRSWAVPLSILGSIAALSLVSFASVELSKARAAANETAAVATLRNIISAQAQFQQSARADGDRDTTGEYGGFRELSGAIAGRMDAPLEPPVLSGAFRTLTGPGVVVRSGYYFRMYVPGAKGRAVGEPRRGFSPSSGIHSDDAETTWCCYAWPVTYGHTGHRTFFTNQGGDVLSTEDARYTGPDGGPAPDTAFDEPGRIVGAVALGETGQDGNRWTEVD